MWTSTSMTIGEALIVSAMGFSIVFSLLIILAVSLVIFAKIFNVAGGKQAGTAPAAAPAVDTGVYARIIAVVCEEMKADPKDIIIKSIKKID